MIALLAHLNFERHARRALRKARRGVPDKKAAWVGDRLVRHQRFDEAETILAAALAQAPDDPALLDPYALAAQNSGRYAQALERWRRARTCGPDRPMPWVCIAAMTRELGDIEAAHAAIREGLSRFPDDIEVLSEAARTFDRLGRHAEAVAYWARLTAARPAEPSYPQGYAYSLAQLNRFADASRVLERALKRFPADRSLFATRGFIAMAAEDWTTALAVWQAFRARYPDDQTGWENQGKTIAAIQHARAEAETLPEGDVKVHIDTVEDDATRSLLVGFESIGADCEFGLVQRRFGAEPIGLLRFNDVRRLKNLMEALDAGFARMGDPDVTTLTVSGNGEYYVSDRRWDLGMHTFLFASQQDAATLLPKMCRRVAFLRDKLLEDLRDGAKVFVYKSDAIDLEALRALHGRLRAFGPARLLHVRRASVPLSDEPIRVAPGEVFLAEPDLYVGFLSRMGNAQPSWDIAFDEWISICEGLRAAPPLPTATSSASEECSARSVLPIAGCPSPLWGGERGGG